MRAGGCTFLLFLAAGPLLAQDPPLDRLLAGPERTDLRWTVSIPPAALSNFQRLWVRIAIRVDGKEIEKRNGTGAFLFAAEFRDSADKPYRTQIRVDLNDYQKATAQHELECVLQAFVLPGVYNLSLAAIEPSTEKLSLTHRTLRVAPLNNDPLPDAWRDFPAVDFIDIPELPDGWFLPNERGRLFLQVENHRPARIEILANVSPTETSRRQGRAYNRNMDAILPAIKILSRIGVRDGSKNVAVIDVARRRVSYEQSGRRELDWPALKQALDADNPNKIDAGSLKERDQDAQFFVSEATRRAVAAPGEQRILIVLSGPVTFTTHQEIQPIEGSPGPHARVYYLRFKPSPLNGFAGSLSAPVRRGPGGVPFPAPPVVANDELERTLKPLQPRLFDIYSPVDFRKALAAILKEIE
jgi:hypothetical protein